MFTKLADAIERAIAEGKVTREEVFRRMLDSARASGVPEEAVRRAARATSPTPVSTLSERLQGKAIDPALREFVRRTGQDMPKGGTLAALRDLYDDVIGATDRRTRAGYEEQRRRRLAPQLAAEDAAKRDYRSLSRDLSDLIEPRSARLADLAGAQQIRNLQKNTGVRNAFDLLGLPGTLFEGLPEGGPPLIDRLRTLGRTEAIPRGATQRAMLESPDTEVRIPFPTDVHIAIPGSRTLPTTRGRLERGSSTFGEKVRSAIELATGRKPPGAFEAAAGLHELGEAEAVRAHTGTPMAEGAVPASIMKPVTLEQRMSGRNPTLAREVAKHILAGTQDSPEYADLMSRIDAAQGKPQTVHVQPHASHMDVRPIVREEVATYGSPSARTDMRRVRSIGADDHLAALAYRRAGGRANAPIAIDSRRERAMRRELAREREMGNLSTAIPYRVAESRGNLTDGERRLPAGMARKPLRDVANLGVEGLQTLLGNSRAVGTPLHVAQTAIANRLAEAALNASYAGRYVPKSIRKK